MAKRRSKEQLKADKIIKKELLKLGDVVWQQATETSRRDTGRLQDEQNYRVVKDTTLEHSQLFYGAFNYPKGKNSGEKNALVIAINEHVPEAVRVITSNVVEKLLDPFKNKK